MTNFSRIYTYLTTIDKSLTSSIEPLKAYYLYLYLKPSC